MATAFCDPGHDAVPRRRTAILQPGARCRPVRATGVVAGTRGSGHPPGLLAGPWLRAQARPPRRACAARAPSGVLSRSPRALSPPCPPRRPPPRRGHAGRWIERCRRTGRSTSDRSASHARGRGAQVPTARGRLGTVETRGSSTATVLIPPSDLPLRTAAPSTMSIPADVAAFWHVSGFPSVDHSGVSVPGTL